MRINLLLAVFLFPFISHSQCGEFGFKYDTVESARYSHILSDKSLFTCSWDYGIMYLRRYDSQGNVIQSRTLNEVKASIYTNVVVDSNDGIFIAGLYEKTISFGPEYNFNEGSGVANNFFVLHVDKNFTTQWAIVSTGNTGASASGNDFVSSLSTDTLGGLYITGEYKGPFHLGSHVLPYENLNQRHRFHSRLNKSTGEVIWIKHFLGNDDSILECDYQGSFFEVTNFTSGCETHDSLLIQSSPQQEDNFIVQHLDSNGTSNWIKHATGRVKVFATELKDNGNLLLLGGIEDYLAIDNDTLFSYFEKGLFYLEMNVLGEIIQKRRIAYSDNFNYFVLSKSDFHYVGDNEYYISGVCKSNVNFNGLIADNPNNADQEYFFATRFDGFHTPIWTKGFVKTQYPISAGINFADSCSVYFYGVGYNSLEYSENQPAIETQYKRISIIMELDPETGNLYENQGDSFGGPNSVGLNELAMIDIEAYPNPVTEILTLQSSLTDQLSFSIFDNLGREVLSGVFTKSELINFVKLAKGVYTLLIMKDSEKKVIRIVKK